MVGAFYICVRNHDQSFEVSLELRDLVAVLAIDFALLGAIFMYTRLKL
jgi:hypothetical protein